MRSYLAPKRDAADAESVRRVPIEGPVGVYRREGNDYAVVAESPETTVALGIRDAAVSRKRDGEPPVEFVPNGQAIRIHNRSSRNPISVATGAGELILSEGESERVRDDCTVELGIATELRVSVERNRDTLSKDELDDLLGMQQRRGGAVMEGVSPAAHVRAVAENLRKASDESVAECRKFATELQNFVADHPVEDPDYDDVSEALDQIVERLEAKSTGPLRGSGLDEQWRDELEVLADRVEKLYNRSR